MEYKLRQNKTNLKDRQEQNKSRTAAAVLLCICHCLNSL